MLMLYNLKLCCSSLHSLSVLAINHIDQAICVVKVMPPERSELFLTANVPYCEEDILVLYLFHIETCTLSSLHQQSVRLGYRLCLLSGIYKLVRAKPCKLVYSAAPTQWQTTTLCGPLPECIAQHSPLDLAVPVLWEYTYCGYCA